MSDNQPINNFGEEWMNPMLSSGPQLYAGGATVSGARTYNIRAEPQYDSSVHASIPHLPGNNISDAPGDTIDPQLLAAFNEHVCYDCSPFKTFNRLGDLTRHKNEKHDPVTASKYLCPIDLCPRGIQGEGFGRMHHLVTHLKSKKHEMSGLEAAHRARMHNLPKSKGQVAQ